MRTTSAFFLMRPISRNFSLFGQNVWNPASVVRRNGTSVIFRARRIWIDCTNNPRSVGGVLESFHIKPPLNEKISEFLSRGFIIFQISQIVRLGVLLFSMFWPFWTIFPCKTAFKNLKIFSRASRANFSSGVLLFSKSLQMFELGVLSTGGG